MISWLWLIVMLYVGIGIGIMIMSINNKQDYPDYEELDITDKDIELSEARLEALWLSKTLEIIARTSDFPVCCSAERWRKDANKWARKIIRKRIRENKNESKN